MYANVTLDEVVHNFMELKQQWIKDFSKFLEVYGQQYPAICYT